MRRRDVEARQKTAQLYWEALLNAEAAVASQFSSRRREKAASLQEVVQQKANQLLAVLAEQEQGLAFFAQLHAFVVQLDAQARRLAAEAAPWEGGGREGEAAFVPSPSEEGRREGEAQASVQASAERPAPSERGPAEAPAFAASGWKSRNSRASRLGLGFETRRLSTEANDGAAEEDCQALKKGARASLFGGRDKATASAELGGSCAASSRMPAFSLAHSPLKHRNAPLPPGPCLSSQAAEQC